MVYYIIFYYIIFQLSRSRAEPGISCIFFSLQTDDGQTVKTRKGFESGTKNTGKVRDTGIAPKRYSWVSTFNLSPRLGSAREIGSTQTSASLTLVTRPAAAAVAPSRWTGCLLQPPSPPLFAIAAFTVSGRTRRRCRRRRRRRPQRPSIVTAIGYWSSLAGPAYASVASCCR